MIQHKEYTRKEMHKKEVTYTIEGPVNTNQLKKFTIHQELKSFRFPEKQLEAMQHIATLPEAQIYVSHINQHIIGYVIFLHPDPKEHWSKAGMKDLLELGAIEVASPYRGNNIANEMLKISFSGPFFEYYIIFTTLYYWHWDLKGTELSIWKYRNMMEKVMNSVGLTFMNTNEPEIRSHPANGLMVRIGKHIPISSIKQFDNLRYMKV